MTTLALNFRDAIVVRADDAERLGWGGATVRLLADSNSVGGALSAVRVSLGKDTEGAKPHTHTGEAELFYVLDGDLQVLAGERLLVASRGDLIVVPPHQPHAFASTSRGPADLLIVIAPGVERFAYFRLLGRLAKGQATLDELKASQDQYDNH